MSGSFYWLISITSESVRSSLVSYDDQNSRLESLGPDTAWSPADTESFVKAVDISLTQSAESFSLPAESEPNSCAFIIPPSWVGDDGKIFGETLHLLESLCKKLDLKPLGFVADDDAFIESYNHQDSFPGSFILLRVLSNRFSLSLVYLGSVKKRLSQEFDGDFSISQFEKCLADINFTSALPPKIVVVGAFTNSLIEDLKNYDWLSNNNIETFLHIPEIIPISSEELEKIFIETIFHQLRPIKSETNQESQSFVSSPEIEEAPVIDELKDNNIITPEIPANEVYISPSPSPDIISPSEKTKPKFSFKLPRLHFYNLLLLPLAFLPVIPILPLFLSKSTVIISFTGTEVNLESPLTLDSTISENSPTSISVNQKIFPLTVNQEIPTTGNIEIGEKAKGEITIFNKADKIQNISKGTTVESGAKKYELLTNTQVPGSSSNLDTGIITMGQTKVMVAAQSIGPESNLPVNNQFSFTDNSNLIAKNSTEISGGTRQQVKAVAAVDRQNLLTQAKEVLKTEAKAKIKSENQVDIIIFDNTAYFENQKPTYNREVGEKADTLSLKLDAKISFLYLEKTKKDQIVKDLIASKPDFANLDLNSADLKLNYNPETLSATKATGNLILSGRIIPKTDIDALKTKLIRTTEKKARMVLDRLPQVYKYDIDTSLKMINLFKLMPINQKNITIITRF